jgi:hypothetical protein
MIDPFKVTDYNRGFYELQEYALFCAAVANKTAVVQAKALDRFLNLSPFPMFPPFSKVRDMYLTKTLRANLEASRIGQYNRLENTFKELAYLDESLRTVETGRLEEIKGIGPKTSRFFILHSRPNQELIVLDTHLIKYFHSKKLIPFNTHPTKKQYAEWEPKLVKYLKEEEGVTDFAQFDLDKWTEGTRTKPNE